MTTLASLKGQLEKIQEVCGDREKIGYAIRPVWAQEKYDGPIYLTPDDALAWCYEDALKRKLPCLKLYVWCAPQWDNGELIHHDFCGFRAERSDLRMIKHADVHNNMIWCYDDTGVSGRDADPGCLAYPSKKPQYELLDYIRAKDIEWHETMAHKTREEREAECGYTCASRDLEDYYSIVTGVRPPNSLPICDQFTCEICKRYDLLKLRKLPDNVDVKDLRDDELIAVIKSEGGNVPGDDTATASL